MYHGAPQHIMVGKTDCLAIAFVADDFPTDLTGEYLCASVDFEIQTHVTHGFLELPLFEFDEDSSGADVAHQTPAILAGGLYAYMDGRITARVFASFHRDNPYISVDEPRDKQ